MGLRQRFPIEIWERALDALERGDLSYDAFRRHLGISRATLYRRIERTKALRVRNLSPDSYDGLALQGGKNGDHRPIGPRVAIWQSSNQQGDIHSYRCEHLTRIRQGDAEVCIDCRECVSGLDHLSDLLPYPTLPANPSLPAQSGLAGG